MMTSIPKGAWNGPFYELMLLYNNVAKLRQKLDRPHHVSDEKRDPDRRVFRLLSREFLGARLVKKASKRRAVFENNGPRRSTFDQADPLKRGDGPANRLNR